MPSNFSKIRSHWLEDPRQIDLLLNSLLSQSGFYGIKTSREVISEPREKVPIPKNPTQKAPHCHKRPQTRPKLHCPLCEKNGEPASVFSSHVLKDSSGIVVCPILRKLACPICKYPGGDYAHTERFCPLNPDPRAAFNKPRVRELKEKINSFGKRYEKRTWAARRPSICSS